MAQLLTRQRQIAALRTAWEAAHPRSAAGVRLALAGFHYQFLCALLASAQVWPKARSGTGDSGPRVFTETLSDLVRADGDGTLVVSQIKRMVSGLEGYQVLETIPITHASWPEIFCSCWENFPGNHHLEKPGLLWLQHTITHENWIRVFYAIWESGSNRELLVNLAQRRLQEQPEGKGADILHEILPEQTLNNMGRSIR